MHTIGLIDVGAGNFASVRNALKYLKVNVLEVRKPEELYQASHLILPGVGAFAKAMSNLEHHLLKQSLHEQVIEKRKPVLGICVGMQLFAEVGYEFETSAGLGFIAGNVSKIDLNNQDLPIPHMGWNQIKIHRESPLFVGITSSPSFYFVHSYQLNPVNSDAILATCDYGGQITACVQQDNIYGVQFHPEKSQRDGLRLLENFTSI